MTGCTPTWYVLWLDVSGSEWPLEDCDSIHVFISSHECMGVGIFDIWRERKVSGEVTKIIQRSVIMYRVVSKLYTSSQIPGFPEFNRNM